jgi:hypothetical protein
MKNLTAARDAVGSEEPTAAGGWFFLWQELHELIELNESNKDRLLDIIYFLGEETGLTSDHG